MRVFKATVADDNVFFVRAQTWFDARNLARRLYPFDSVDPMWPEMLKPVELVSDIPDDAVMYELYQNEIVFTPGYEKDLGLLAKKRKKNRKEAR